MTQQLVSPPARSSRLQVVPDAPAVDLDAATTFPHDDHGREERR